MAMSSTAPLKSGWSSSRPAGSPVSTATARSALASISRRSAARASTAARISTVAKRAHSAGCSAIGSPGTASQRRAPFASIPTTSVMATSPVPSAQSSGAARRHRPSGTREAAQAHATAMATPVRWRAASGGNTSPMASPAVAL
jgi:hypothetical protein